MDTSEGGEPPKHHERFAGASFTPRRSVNTTHEHVDLPFGLKSRWVRRFYVWLTDFYSRHNVLSLLLFSVGFVITALLLPLTVSGPVGIGMGAVLSFVLALVSPVAVLITRNTSHYQ